MMKACCAAAFLITRILLNETDECVHGVLPFRNVLQIRLFVVITVSKAVVSVEIFGSKHRLN